MARRLSHSRIEILKYSVESISLKANVNGSHATVLEISSRPIKA